MNNRKHKCFDENGELIITQKEQKAINTLKKLSKTWPNTIWIFAADGKLNIMKKNEDNYPAMNNKGSVDQDYIIEMIDIDADGGDW